MRSHRIALVAGTLALAVIPGAAARAGQSPPHVGMNYTELSLDGPCGRRYIVRHGNESGARQLMTDQLAAMRAAGVEILRFFIWYDHDGAAFEAIPSAGGQLVEPYRSNFVAYLQVARSLGYKRIEIVFGPVLANDPMAIYGGVPYDPALFEENWSLIRDVRALAKEFGPPSRFDLLNEGAPSDAQPLKAQIMDYLTRIYRRYVDSFGNDDVTVSTIYQHIDPSRLPNLISALRASGRPMPTYFEVHPDYFTVDALRDLIDTDDVLARAGLRQPLEVGEGPYNDAAFAAVVKSFISTSQRDVTDVLVWPLRLGSSCKDFSVAPPYRIGNLVQRLQGAATLASTRGLGGSVTPAGASSLINGVGLTVTALESGTFRLRVDDRSTAAGFILRGPGVHKQTAASFRGTVVWRLALRPGSYVYRATRGPRGRFVVLRAR
jgi:hypothetical protein